MTQRPVPEMALAQSECIAIRALGFLKYNNAGPGQPVSRDIMTRALDLLIKNEQALQAFAALVDLPPEAAYEARRQLCRSPAENTH